MAATAPPFFADRMPPDHPRATAAERTAYDRYLAARNHYKEELLDEVVAAASDSPGGPVLEVGTGYGGSASNYCAARRGTRHWSCTPSASRRRRASCTRGGCTTRVSRRGSASHPAVSPTRTTPPGAGGASGPSTAPTRSTPGRTRPARWAGWPLSPHPAGGCS
ncbi:hypothetical protein [Streptomyces rhizosphaericus]|uniref:hypothetical protein n=1 Tax=Streptomyces rhizosphaericus TaxID=114699 RepID=UPI00363DF971